MIPADFKRSEEELKTWLLRSLGAPIVKVELTADHLSDVILDTRRWFAAKKGIIKRLFFQYTTGQEYYQLPDDADKVLDVAFTQAKSDIALLYFPFNLFDNGMVPYDVFHNPFGGGMYSSFVQALQMAEQAKRILSSETDWSQTGDRLYLFPLSAPSGVVFVEYKSNRFTVDQMDDRDYDLFSRFALASAKKLLGRVRSKYDAFPGAQGDRSLDGAALLDEAAVELEALNEEITKSAYPMGFLIG